MTVPTHLKVVFRGVFTGTPETWSFHLKFSRDNPSGQDASLSDVNTPAMATALQTFMTNASVKFPNNAKLVDVRSYIIGTDGRMEGNPEIHNVEASNITGVTTMVYPPQICLVITSVGANRGLARFGRVFIPTACPVQSTDSLVATSQIDAIMTPWTTFVKACSDAVDLELTQSSEGLNISNRQGGVRQTIDHYEIGRALDTLRSRRRALLEQRRVSGHIDW